MDKWGVTWHNAEEGLSSIPVDESALLKDWYVSESYKDPDQVKHDISGNEID